MPISEHPDYGNIESRLQRSIPNAVTVSRIAFRMKDPANG